MGGALDEVLEQERREGKQEGIREGMLEGERTGKRLGKREEKKTLSLNMLKCGLDYKMVAEISEVSVEQVKAWEKERDQPS